MEISFDMKIIKNLHITLSSSGYFSWKRSKFALYEPMIKRSAGGVFIWSKKASCWKNWSVWADNRKRCWRSLHLIEKNQLLKKLTYMKSIIERSADGVPDWSERSSVKKIDLYGAGGKKECWQSFIVLSQLLILMYIELFSLIIFHLLCFFLS